MNIREYYSNTCPDPRFFEYLNRGPPEYYSNQYSANTVLNQTELMSCFVLILKLYDYLIPLRSCTSCNPSILGELLQSCIGHLS
jgi:hypothetical protein